ncbi:hypothetical protein F5Y05DRAFT_106654 [Hypoxylon sp. FL0543]|nr:hypothetical protein F5Y05DRAFT_106654 [Hypoxylon sp. FL0543]
MPFTPVETHASSSKMAGKSSSGRPRKRARNDTSEESPRVKALKTIHNDKHEQLQQNLESSTLKFQDALAELQRINDEQRGLRARIDNVIEALQCIKLTISTSSLIHNNIQREEKLERENAELRERIKELEAAAEYEPDGVDEVPLKARRTRASTSPLSEVDQTGAEKDSSEL